MKGLRAIKLKHQHPPGLILLLGGEKWRHQSELRNWPGERGEERREISRY